MGGNGFRIWAFFLALLFVSSFSSCEKKTGEKPLDGRAIFIMEYDCQINYNVFFTGTEKADSAFSQANTDLDIFFSDIIDPALVVPYESLGYYIDDYWETIYLPGEGTILAYKSYMIAIEDASNKPEGPGGGTLLGETRGGGEGGVVFAIIFVGAIRNLYPGDQNMETKTPIHEMGHVRAKLSELCDTAFIYVMNPDHNDSNCVMGQVKIATCTDKDVSINPHFCDSCLTKLKKVIW